MYICSQNKQFMCRLCVMQTKPAISGDSLILFEPNQVISVAKLLSERVRKSFESLINPLVMLQSLNVGEKPALLRSLKYGSDLLNTEDLMQLKYDQANVIQVLTGKPVRLRMIQLKLQRSNCLVVILSFIEPTILLEYQVIAKKFYNEHVPMAIPKIDVLQI